MGTSRFRFKKPEHYSLEKTILSHGWVNLCPFKWDGASLTGAFEHGNNALGFAVAEGKQYLSVTVEGANGQLVDRSEIADHFRYSLSLDFRMDEFIGLCQHQGRDDLAKMATYGWGRLLRSMSPWEDAVKTLLTTNCSWTGTQRMVKALCSVGSRTPSGRSAFPTAPSILGIDLEDLGLGYRASYLRELSEKVASDELQLEELINGAADKAVAETAIRSIKGFGDYAADHLLVLLGWHEFLPLDREVMANLEITPQKNGRPPKNLTHYKEFGDFRFSAYKLDRIRTRSNWIG